MKNRKIYVLIILIGLIGFKVRYFTEVAWATGFQELNYQVKQGLINNLKFEMNGVKEIYGEIITINKEEVILKTSNEEVSLKLSSNSKLFCNNQCCFPEALRPVAPEAFFEAQVLYNEHQEVLVLNAFYYGAEYILITVKKLLGETVLFLEDPESGRMEVYLLDDRAELPWQIDCLPVKQAVYVLFQMNGGIRAVFFRFAAQNS